MLETIRGAGRGRGSYRGSVCSRDGRRKPMNFHGNSNSYEGKNEMNFPPHGHRKHQQVIYSTAKDVIVQNIQKDFYNGYNISSSLENIELIDLLPDKK